MAAEPNRIAPALKDNGLLIETLWRVVNDGAGTLDIVPNVVKRVLETGAWRKRVYKGRVFEHESFAEFITAQPLSGCGWPLKKVEALIKDDPDTLVLWNKAITNPVGTNQHTMGHDNIMTLPARQGTSKAYTLSRLKSERPDLYEIVVDGGMSANKAAIQAGFRKKESPFEQIQRLLPKLSASEKKKLRGLL